MEILGILERRDLQKFWDIKFNLLSDFKRNLCHEITEKNFKNYKNLWGISLCIEFNVHQVFTNKEFAEMKIQKSNLKFTIN